jgi:hypothetical protein
VSESPTSDDDLTGEPEDRPPGEHEGDLPDESDATGDGELQEENAETSLDQPSQ